VVTITLGVADEAALRELFDQQLSKGRAFVRDVEGVGERQACDLVIDHKGRTFHLAAEAVFVKAEGPGKGVGLQLVPLDAAAKAALRAFVDGGTGAEQEPKPEPEPQPEPEPEEPGAKSLFERIRGLSNVEQQRLAASGTIQERVALERAFGANVWEALLSNARLTVPEVARIARKGTLPRQLVEDIAGHASWVAAPEVQRALLGNPRSTTAVVTKVLHALSRSDLQLVPQQTAYPQAVRSAAKKMLGR
jgi:hypothetical protein